MKPVYKEAANLARQNREFVLATVVNTKGSTPQKPGATLLVRADGSTVGTLGGGCVEGDIWFAAKEVLRERTGPVFKDYYLNEDIAARDGLVCGGSMYFYIEPFVQSSEASQLANEIEDAFEGGDSIAVATVVNGTTLEMGARIVVQEDGTTEGTLGNEQVDAIAIAAANEFEAAIVHAGPDTVAAMIAEPVSAATGIQIPPPEYWHRLREIADKHDVILIADEVITGFGRLGTWFGADAFGVKPDITAVAKALTSGYAPLGAAIATKRVADAFVGDDSKTFKHLITFGGHPVAAAAGIKNLEIMEREDLPGASARMGEYLLERLETLYEHPSVGDVRGLGLLAAVELVKDRDSKEAFPATAELMSRLPKKLYDKKIVSFRAGDIIAMCPPLSISRDEVDFIVNALDETIGEVEAELGIS